ncbi:MAG: toll/interleukin-1 receptor domain-containing protein [Pleurocapsa minor GSE-CHR-MK-17-07R]|jgi:hypothetical protein|nr:toll/interleukin-1 receptor domain-containing protein [Pleurocapsa minor GSE-CHR-MK 17-07R]
MNLGSKPPRKVFISYRRDDNADFVYHIRTWFGIHYGLENVYIDIASNQAGAEFDKVIKATVQDCDVFVPIIGPKWLKILEQNLIAKAIDSGKVDYVNEEIALAVKENKYMCPICIKGAKVPREKQLPAEIRPMLTRHVIQIPDAEALYTKMESVIGDIEKNLSRLDQPRKEIQKLEETSPAAGLALGYYNFIQSAVRSINQKKEGSDEYQNDVVILDSKDRSEIDRIGTGAADRADVRVNIVVPSKIHYATFASVGRLKEHMREAVIRAAARPISFLASENASGHDLFDIPTTLSSMQSWIERRINLRFSHPSKDEWWQDGKRIDEHTWYRSREDETQFLQQEQIERFGFVLKWWVDGDDLEINQRIRILWYDPDDTTSEMAWLRSIWK